MLLEKDPQQEDYLQGRMQGNPYSSKDAGLGPLMRDVKNKICTGKIYRNYLTGNSLTRIPGNLETMCLLLNKIKIYWKIGRFCFIYVVVLKSKLSPFLKIMYIP